MYQEQPTAKLDNELTIMELNSGLERVSQTLNQLKLPIIRRETGENKKHLHLFGIKYFGIWRKWSIFEWNYWYYPMCTF